MTVVALTGRVLWRDQPGAPPAWREGAWIVDGRMTVQAPEASAIEHVGGYAVPGLVDVHCHLGYGSDGVTGPDQTLANARKVVESGVLAVRDAGVPERANDCLIGRDDAPRLIRCGRHIARPKRYIRGLGVDLADPAQLPDEMARQAAAGDGWVKIVGDWIDRAEGVNSLLRPLWTPRQLAEGVSRAHAAGARVAVHAFSAQAIGPLLDAGVDDIEHGTGMDRAAMRRARAAGVPVTPTLLQVGLFDTFAAQAGTKYPAYRDQMRAMWTARRDHFQALLDEGVTLLPGTDSGGYQRFGSLPDELALWEEYGAAAADVLAFATWRARDFLGLDSLSEGAPADVVVYRRDPAASTSVLAAPARVYRAGRRLV
ncbi:MAG: amidohydrolase family protein [Actinomycetaceae bacterium]|nr:amidohydrolase family protein [Actinomycetaceae bacterium]MDU0970127.1 amidohydrolase family protein [Actinomycetaceae bacterium]